MGSIKKAITLIRITYNYLYICKLLHTKLEEQENMNLKENHII